MPQAQVEGLTVKVILYLESHTAKAFDRFEEFTSAGRRQSTSWLECSEATAGSEKSLPNGAPIVAVDLASFAIVGSARGSAARSAGTAMSPHSLTSWSYNGYAGWRFCIAQKTHGAELANDGNKVTPVLASPDTSSCPATCTMLDDGCAR